MSENSLSESQLYHFFDSKHGVAFYFLEAQKIINDVAVTHHQNSKAFSFNRDVVLSLLPLSAFLKPKESMGLFIDSETPYFRFKLESNFTGTFRTMMLPEELDEVPKKLKGKCRITKIMPSSNIPYNSIVKMDNITTEETINHILEQSFQTKSRVLLSEKSDQAVLINLLPAKDYDKKSLENHISFNDVISKYSDGLKSIMNKALLEKEEVISAFSEQGLDFLSSKKMKFFCPCSKISMIKNVQKISIDQLQEIFKEDGELNITCDYCQAKYNIQPNEVKGITSIQ